MISARPIQFSFVKRACLALLALASLAPSRARADEPPPKSELVLGAGWGGHFFVVDEDHRATIAELDKAPADERSLELPPGDYRVVLSGADGQPLAYADVEIAPGARVIVDSSLFHLFAPPAATAPAIPIVPGPKPPRLLYPRTLAARSLTMPAHLVELGAFYRGIATRHSYISDDYGLTQARWAVTDRFEVRDLGVYYAIVPHKSAAPEVGAGAALTDFNYPQDDRGAIFTFTGWFDAKQHLGSRVALQARLRYDLTVETGSGYGPDHHLFPGLDLFIDVAPIVSLIASGEYEWTRLRALDEYDLSTASVNQRWGAAAGIYVSPASWMDLQITAGPSWLSTASSAYVLAARAQITALFHF